MDMKHIFEFSDDFNFKKCEMEVVRNKKFKNERAVKITNKDLKTERLFIAESEDNWNGFDYLQISAFSENATGGVIKFQALTGENTGYEYLINISWTGHKILTFPLYKGIVTFGDGVGTFERIIGYRFQSFYGVPSLEETEIYVDSAWITNTPIPDKERLIEVNENTDYIIEAEKNQPYDILSLLKEKFPQKSHPRLIATEVDFEKIKEYVKTVPFMSKAYDDVKSQADEALDLPVAKYELSDGRRLTRQPLKIVPPLLIAYIVSGEKKYKDRAWEEVKALSKFPDWNPAHSIDLGDIARPVAFAYDWLYYEWTEEEKRIMRNGMVKNGIEPMLTQLRQRILLAVNEGNHNTVTFSGVGLIALAIADENGYEELANEVICETIEAIPHNLKTFAPYGACPEGTQYWNYGQSSYYMYEAALFSSLGTDFGMKDLPGMDTTGDYLMAMSGISGESFNYADANVGTDVRVPSLLWLAELYDKYEYAQFYLEKKTSKGHYLELLYFKEGMDKGTYLKNAKKDYFLGNVGSLKSSTTDKNAIYVGFKGGKREDHMDLDFGSFVLEMQGERFIVELGCEVYDMPGMWEYSPAAGRWNYYRKRAEGNNTLVINPKYEVDYLSDQNPYADCNIIYTESKDDFGQCIVDLTSAYPEKAEEVTRSYSLCDNRKLFKLRDTVRLKKESEIYSFFHTKSDVEIIDSKTAVLTQNGKSVSFKVNSDTETELLLMEAEPLLEEFKNQPHKDNSEYKKIAIHCKNIKNAVIEVIIDSI